MRASFHHAWNSESVCEEGGGLGTDTLEVGQALATSTPLAYLFTLDLRAPRRALAESGHSSLVEASLGTHPPRVHVPVLASRRVAVDPRQAAARPPLYLLSPPPRRQPKLPAPGRNCRNGRDAIDE